MSAHRLRPPQVTDPAQAWGLLVSNLLVVPGLGSVMGGRRLTGCVQMVAALSGMVLTLVLAADMVSEFLRTREIPQPEGVPLLLGGVGALLFIAAWLWALATSLSILKEARAAADASRCGSNLRSGPGPEGPGVLP